MGHLSDHTTFSINDILCQAQERFAWSARATSFSVVDVQDNGKRSFYRCRGAGGSAFEVLAKVERGGPDVAERAYLALCRLAPLYESATGGQVTAPRALAWIASPPILIMQYVEGEDIHRILRRARLGMGGEDRERLARIMANCGRALGAEHSASAAGVSSADRERMVARLRASLPSRRQRSTSRFPEEPLCAVTTPDDFNPTNLRLAPEGIIYVLDPCVRLTPHLAHQDVASVITELFRHLSTGAERRPRSVLLDAWYQLSSSFAAGYVETGPVNLFDDAHLELLDTSSISLARSRINKHLAKRRFKAAAALMSWLIRARFRRDYRVSQACTVGLPGS